MPQILIIGCSEEFCEDVQAVADSIKASELGIRTKTTTSIEHATSWLELGGFNAVIFDPQFEFEQQSKLASLLWDKSLLAPFILYAPEKPLKYEAQSRLMGSEPYFGSEARKKLEQTLISLSKLQPYPGAPVLLKVAVVEDLDSPRDIICTYLEGVDNLQTVGFADVDSFISSIQKNPKAFDLVITDIRMPHKSGAELIDIVRKDPKLKHLPIIVLTAYGTADVMMECLKAGATGFMVKPPKKKDLKNELSKVRRILAYGMDPRMVFPHEVDRMREMLAAKGLF